MVNITKDALYQLVALRLNKSFTKLLVMAHHVTAFDLSQVDHAVIRR